MNFLLEPLGYTFLLRGLLGGFVVAIACASLSAFVVWRGMSFMGDALAHAMLPGVVLAYALGIALFWGALMAVLLSVAGIALISRKKQLNEDAAIGVVFAGFFALGLLLLSKVASSVDLSHILFGDILGITKQDLTLMLVIAVIVLVTVILCFKELVTTSFDSDHAKAIGLSPNLVLHILLGLLALTTVTAIQTVGVVLVLALLVSPGAAASLISRSLIKIQLLSISMAILATVIGFYTSYYVNVSSGPAIVLALTGMFILCALFSYFRDKRSL